MFSSVLDKLDTWIGRNFLVASFFPFFLFGVANIFMAQFILPGKVAEIVAFFSSGYFGPINATFGLLAACAILAYITNPFVRLLTEGIEGQLFILAHKKYADRGAKSALRQVGQPACRAGQG